jgi:hypothetical protein
MTLSWTALGALAATQPPLGQATSFAILAGSTVTNTGPTVINGGLGLSAGSSVTGFPPGILNGESHVDDSVAVGAKHDLGIAFGNAFDQGCDKTLTGDLGNRTLVPGVYCYPSDAVLTGTLTLDGKGDANAVFIFKFGSALTTASNSRVSVINGGACGVYWQVGSSATLGTDTAFVGTLMAYASITLNTRATIEPGRALAETAAVTMDSNVITRPPDTCTLGSASTTPTPAPSPSPSASDTPLTITALLNPGGPPRPPIVTVPGAPTVPGLTSGPSTPGQPNRPGLPRLPRAGAMLRDLVIAVGARLIATPAIIAVLISGAGVAYFGTLVVRRRLGDRRDRV